MRKPLATLVGLGTHAWIVAAHRDGESDHYAATVVFPSAGEWVWHIEGFVNTTPERALVLAAPTSQSATDSADVGHGVLDWLSAPTTGTLTGTAVLSIWLPVQRRQEALLRSQNPSQRITTDNRTSVYPSDTG